MSVFKLENTNWGQVNAAVKFCNEMLLNPDIHLHDFLQDIESKEFNMTEASGDYIAKKLLWFIQQEHRINIVFYRSRNPWSKAYGYYTKARPFDININTRRMNRTTASFVATFIHEMIHAIDGLDMVYDYGHGDNSSAGKQDTAPYWIGTLASKYYGQEQDPNDYPRTVRTPWYVRLWRIFF